MTSGIHHPATRGTEKGIAFGNAQGSAAGRVRSGG
jgi:hypothetical protein